MTEETVQRGLSCKVICLGLRGSLAAEVRQILGIPIVNQRRDHSSTL
jgi:hypothetical protein